MTRLEEEPSLILPITIKNPTVLDLARLLRTQGRSPQVSITCIGRKRKNTLFDIINSSNTNLVLKKLEALEEADPFTQLPGEIIVHQFQKT